MLCLSLAPLAAVALLAPDVVELKDGTRHPGEVRSRRNAIELATPLGVQRFQAEEIASIERRADQLPLYQSALGTAGRQPHALVSLSRWCLERGLYPEAFDCLDRAHAVAPQDPAVAGAMTTLIDEAVLDGVATGLPPDVDQRERLLERVGGRSASRAAFAKALLLQAPSEELVSWLVEELNDLDHPVRIGAIDLLGALRSDKGLAKLIKFSLVDESGSIREHARAAAVRSEHPELALPYLRALQIQDETIRTRAYPALAELRDPRAVPALIHMLEPHPIPAGGGSGTLPRAHVYFGVQRSFVQDFDTEIAQGAVIAKPVIGVISSGTILDVAVAGVVQISHVERAAVVSALRRLSGRQDLGDDPVAWSNWWSAQGGRLPDPPPAATTPAADDRS